MPAEPTFTETFVRSMLFRIGLALGAMALSYAGSVLGDLSSYEWGPFAGGVTGLVLGVVLVVLVLRRTGTQA